uniref:Uncharacterized protein n=1 Tax=Panagrolaimus sp. ES5 TaxID=591445 RepID=A0AC34GTI2_9BILA
MRFSTVCVFGLVFILNNSMASPLGLARVFNSKAGPEKSSSSSEEIPQVVIEISTIAIPSVTTQTTAYTMENTTPAEVTESTTANIIDSSTEMTPRNQSLISSLNETSEHKNETSLGRSKRSCRGFECEQMSLPPPQQQSPPCFGPRCAGGGGYGCGCGFSCTIKFRPCCQRCPQQQLPPPPPPQPSCNNNGCALPPPSSGCRFPQPSSPAACPCPQQPEERPQPSACECQPACNGPPALPPPPPPPPPRCGCTPRGCGCIRPPLMPSPINIHINGMGGMGGMNGGDMEYPPPMPYRNPCASCACPAPVCRCPPACTKQCGPAGCNNNNNIRSPQTPYPRFPDYDYPQNAPRDNDYFDYNSYRHRRSLLNLQNNNNNLGRFPYSKS